jgi:Glycosyl hydrolase family 10
MGDLRFIVPKSLQLDDRIWATAYITGIEGIPWFCHRHFDGEQFSIGRDIEESGKLNIIWPTKSFGNVCLSTTSLRIVEKPYSLVVELARGTVFRMKNQCSEWQRMGLKLPTDFFPLAEQALTQFLKAVTTNGNLDQQAEFAQSAIDHSSEAAVLICDAFSSQVLEIRQQNEGRFSTLLGCRLQPEIELASVQDALKSAFNLLVVDANLSAVESASGRRDFSLFDSQVEWAHQNGHRVCIGPMVSFRPGGLPRWMVLLNENFETVQSTACQHVSETVQRYKGRVHLWNCGVGLNSPGEMGWSDEEVLKMSVALIETVRHADDRTPVLLTIDQPWSEYLGTERDGISPLHFADALIRADLGLSGLALQLDFDTWPDGTFPRDPIEISRMIDRWGMLGLPLMIVVTHPTSIGSRPIAPLKKGQIESVSGWSPGVSDGVQGIGSESVLRMLLAKPTIHAVIWNQMSDQTANALPNAGLWDCHGKAKSLLNAAAKLRQTFLH